MDVEKVAPGLLDGLDKSPLWPWDMPPTLMAVVGEDPVILLTAFSVTSLSGLVALAGQWSQRMPADAVPMDGLILVSEGWVNQAEGVRVEVRDVTIAEKDGTISLFRHTRNGGVEQIELDPATPAQESVEAMRLVAASSWRD